jgi:formylglycine-generating enzyme required for sulfatase activity
MAGDGGSSGTITISRTELKRLVDQEVARQLSATAAKKKSKRGPPGPSGPQGPAGPQGASGAAPACQGNGSGDVMVSAGAVCIDRFEVSVWSSPTGGTQYGASSDNYPCNDTGQGCQAGTPGQIYARSVAGATPSAFITWFQAQQALANVGKRLPTNAEWQQAVAGTPDSAACNVSTGTVANAGASAGCVSAFGANDMVGNLDEWVADWFPVGTACPGWFPNGTFSSDDTMCLAGASAATGPGALIRGGNFTDGTDAGPFYAFPNFKPQDTNLSVGFRGAR